MTMKICHLEPLRLTPRNLEARELEALSNSIYLGERSMTMSSRLQAFWMARRRQILFSISFLTALSVEAATDWSFIFWLMTS